MTLPASFPLSASQINVELGRAPTAPFDIQGAEERELAEVPSGAISFSDFLGKSYFRAEFIGYTPDYTLGTNYTFTAVDIGEAQSNREVFIGVNWAGGAALRGLASATIGGVAATIKNQAFISDGVSQSVYAAVIYASIPSGTTADVVLNFGGQIVMAVVAVYAVYGRTGFSDDFTDTYSGANPAVVISSNNTISDKGIVIAAATFSAENDGLSWVGVTETYEDVDSGGTLNEQTRYGGGLILGLSAQTNYTVSATQTSTTPPTGAALAGVCLEKA